MSPAGEIDKTIQGLLPLETYRSPWIPTNRLGTQALVAIAAPLRQATDESVAPTAWFAVTPGFGALLAFNRTSLVTPVLGFRPAPVVRATSGMTAREAHGLFWRLSGSLWSEFFGGSQAPTDLAREIRDAVDATVPARLQPWLRMCCGDFFDWLGDAASPSSAATSRPVPEQPM